MPEYSYGVNKVKVQLKNGDVFRNVYVAWGFEIVKFGKSTIIPFNAEDVVDVKNDL